MLGLGLADGLYLRLLVYLGCLLRLKLGELRRGCTGIIFILRHVSTYKFRIRVDEFDRIF